MTEIRDHFHTADRYEARWGVRTRVIAGMRLSVEGYEAVKEAAAETCRKYDTRYSLWLEERIAQYQYRYEQTGVSEGAPLPDPRLLGKHVAE